MQEIDSNNEINYKVAMGINVNHSSYQYFYKLIIFTQC